MNTFYHVYNHANGWDNLFETPEHYSIFLQKAIRFLHPVATLHAYCLMPNHFHLLIKIREEFEMINKIVENEDLSVLINMELRVKKLMKLKSLDPIYFITQQFSNFFNSYAQILNKSTKRRGSLFQRSYKSIEVADEEYFRNVVRYIHRNPVHHNFTSRPEDWDRSSYNEYKYSREGVACQSEVLNLFGGLDNFIEFHEMNSEKEDWDF